MTLTSPKGSRKNSKLETRNQNQKSQKNPNYVRLRNNNFYNNGTHNSSGYQRSEEEEESELLSPTPKYHQPSPKLKILSVKKKSSNLNNNDFDLAMFSEHQLEYLKSKINVRLTEISSRGGSRSKKVKSSIGDHLIYKPKVRSILADELDGMDTERTDIETPASEPILNAYKTFKN